MKDLIKEIKKKRELSGLPDSIIERASEMAKGDVKESRALLRKYFGVFLTNKVLKGKGDLLAAHISSKERNYEKIYRRIIDDEDVIFDLGCGVNGFSYGKILSFGKKKYVGVEAVEQLVKIMNEYFNENSFDALAICEDLMKYGKVLEIISREDGKKSVWLFNVVDAIESFEKDYSKKLIEGIFDVDGVERIVIGLPIRSISGRKKFNVSRLWLIEFLEKKYNIVNDFLAGYERILVIEK